MDGSYLVVILGGNIATAFRCNNSEVADAIVERLGQIRGYSAIVFNDPPRPGPQE